MQVLRLPPWIFSLLLIIACKPENKEPVFVELFNGKDLTGWKASEHDSSWTVVDGVLQGVGPRAHLFYVGEELRRDTFKNFELITEVKTHKLANSGVYFHTSFNPDGWPSEGIEVQVNNSHPGEGDFKELKKTGSLYGTRNIYQTFTPDSTWFTLRFIVQGKSVRIWVDSMMTVDYTEPDDMAARGVPVSRLIHQGTFALQCHDPLSKVHYRSIRVKRLPDDAPSLGVASNFGAWHDSLRVMQSRQYAFIDLNPKTDIGMDSMLKYYYQSGINVSLVLGLDEVTTGSHSAALAMAANLPVFKGLRVNQDNIGSLTPEMTRGFDYVVGESTDLLKAWKLVQSGKLQVWAHNGPLENFHPLLKLAKTHNTAIEINNETKTPSLEMIKEAKIHGLKFTFSNLVPSSKMEASTYVMDVVKSAGITYKDLYVPKGE